MSRPLSSDDPSRDQSALPSVCPFELIPESFSPRITACRKFCFSSDPYFIGKPTERLLSDEFDARSIHFVAGSSEQSLGAIRLTFSQEGSRLPFQDFYPDFTETVQDGDAEVSRFVISPAARGGYRPLQLVHAVFSAAAANGTERLFIDVVTGGSGMLPKSYEKHFGFEKTGLVSYDAAYECCSELLMLRGRDTISRVSEELRRRVLFQVGREV